MEGVAGVACIVRSFGKKAASEQRPEGFERESFSNI